MKIINHLFKVLALTLLVSSLIACTSHRKAGANGEGAGLGANGAYAQGIGEGEGYGDLAAICHVPQTPGFKTQSFYFDYDKYDVHSEDLSRIQALAQSIAANHSSIRVVGNTDDRGSREYNMALGWKRANAVVAILKQDGVSANSISANSNGAEKPVAFGSSEQDFQCNRRVDVLYRE